MNAVDLTLAVFEIFLLFTAFLITTHDGVKGAILYYRIQSFLLAFVTGSATLIVLLKQGGKPILYFGLIPIVIFLPLTLGISIEWLLARATIQASQNLFRFSRVQSLAAKRAWLRQISEVSPVTVALFLGLIGLSTAVAFGGVLPLNNPQFQFDLLQRISLLVSISLFLTGLLNTASKSDIISQVIGLLTMDHGLYLAVVKIVHIPTPAWLFILALYFYTFITISIIVVIIPKVRYEAGSIHLDEIASGSDLEG
jgi:hydrogenase-4 membrane subunit HyfE